MTTSYRKSGPMVTAIHKGAGLDLKGNLLVSEHGPRGGDEVNLVFEGKNYGWPVIGYGVHYSGQKVGIGTTNEGMEQPELYWWIHP